MTAMLSRKRRSRPHPGKEFVSMCVGCFDWLEAYLQDLFTGPALAERYRDLEYLARELQSGSVVLIKGSWLLQQVENRNWFVSTLLQSRKGCALPYNKDLPPEAKWDPEELLKKIWKPGSWRIKIVAVPFAWQTLSHPDPNGEQTRILVRVIEQWMKVYRAEHCWDLALFIDFCSLPQCGNSARSFQDSMKNIDLWFAHEWTDVWLMPREISSNSIWATPKDMNAYMNTWEFYSALSRLEPFGKCKCVLDLSKLDSSCTEWAVTESVCTVERLPSLPPERFSESLRAMSDNGEARRVLEDIYTKTFEAFTSNVKDLVFHGSSDDDTKVEQLKNVLPYYKSLNTLVLSGHNLGDSGACSVLQVLPQNRFLCCLNLDSNDIGSPGVQSLVQSLPKLKKLTQLSLQDNRIGDDDIEALARAATECPRLSVLHLDGNYIGSKGIEEFAKYLPSCRKMAKLYLCRNRIGVDGACALSRCIAECWSLVQLWLDRNAIADAGVDALAARLYASSSLEKLSLAENNIGDAGGHSIVNAIPVSHSLLALSLLGNHIDDSVQCAILKAWRQAGKKLEALFLPTGMVQKVVSHQMCGRDRRASSDKARRVKIIVPDDVHENGIKESVRKEPSRCLPYGCRRYASTPAVIA